VKRIGTLLVIVGVLVAIGRIVERRRGSSSPAESTSSTSASGSPSGLSADQRSIDQELAPQAGTQAPRDGLAAAVLIDTSGSMEKPAAGRRGPSKISIAREAALNVVDQFVRYAADHTGESVVLGVFEFSSRSNHPDCREVIAMGTPDRERAAAAVSRMTPGGGTPIGGAMICAKHQLDKTGLARRHLVVITDGENTDGFEPEDVTKVMGLRPYDERASIYFVAFDIEASRFTGVRDAGGYVLEAANGKELGETLDSLLRGKILVEK